MNKNDWIYFLIAFIVYVIIFLGFIIVSKISPSINKKNEKDKISLNESQKINDNFFWIYSYPNENKDIIIPYFNIKNKKLAKINKQNLNEDLTKIKNANYLYSINGDLLSLMYKIEYQDNIIYHTYNFNLGTNKIMNSAEVFKYLDKDYDEVINNLISSIKSYISNLNYSEELLNEYLTNTLSKLYDKLSKNDLNVYVGSNKEINIIVTIYHKKEESILITVIDK